MSTTEPEYIFKKGVGWVLCVRQGRTAEETQNLEWRSLKTGDAVFVTLDGVIRIARVHKADNPKTLEPDDYGAWFYGGGGRPFRPMWFRRIGHFVRVDAAWDQLEGVVLPGGQDYVP